MQTFWMWMCAVALCAAGCTGGAAGDPSDDVGDIFVLSTSPGNGVQLDNADSLSGFNALDNPTLRNPGAVTVLFTNSLLPASVLNPDPSDPQGTRNIRLFFFDLDQGPFDPDQPRVSGVNPPGANVLIPATTILTTTNLPNDTLVIRPTGLSSTNPLRQGQYSVIVEPGVRGSDGDGMKGAEYFFFFRVGEDDLGPVVIGADPAPGEAGVEPTRELRIQMSETILGSTVNQQNILVQFQPAGALNPTTIPGTWFVDGGNGPGNNFPAVQLDQNGIPGFSGTSPRNGADIVFRPDTTIFPVNYAGEDPNDPFCTLIADPPRKGNRGYPLGQAITVTIVTPGIGVTDTAGNPVPAGSPNTSFTFQTRSRPSPVFAPNTSGAVYFGDTVGVGVIDVNPARTPYLIGPNPGRSPNTVVSVGAGTDVRTVRVPIPDFVEMTSDDRPWTAFHAMVCNPFVTPPPSLFMGNVYALSGSRAGGQVVVIDSFSMAPMGRFSTASPGGIAITSIGNQGRAAVTNFSANTVTVFDIGRVAWYTGGNILQRTNQLIAAEASGATQLMLREVDFDAAFPAQLPGFTSPPGPPIIGTLAVGVGPSRVAMTGLRNSLGIDSNPCFSPFLTNDSIVCVLNFGERTADFSHLTNLGQSVAIQPDLDGVNLSSEGLDVAWSTWSFRTRSYYFFISGTGGAVELFASGSIAGVPSVRPGSAGNLAPNTIINNIGGFEQPSEVLWITNGNGVTLEFTTGNYTGAVLVAETGRNRLQQIAITSEFPSNLFDTINASHSSGLGPVSMTGDPSTVLPFVPCGPTFTTYYVANAGEGTVRSSSYLGGVIGANIPVPGILQVSSWWSR